MPISTDPSRRRRLLPAGVTGLAALACAACCVLPVLLAAGVIGGAGAVALTNIMPMVALGLAGVTVLIWGLAWFLRSRRRVTGCAGGDGCGCHSAKTRQHLVSDPLQSRL
ncbi:hypothetical protein GCM10022226_03630 [Sphaerisporangium flaviroseum]|uniref:Mercuric ion transport protein n=1 Tax=Sphaerisporangium flaviroseum TaxID=509199 RepID=A0ABP7HE27_9ACTN